MKFWRLCAGACVSSTQELLNGKGASLTVDGDFGPLTTQATKNFQSSKGLSVSRTVSWRTLACVSLPELVASTEDAAPSDPFLMWRSARSQADGIVGPNTKDALYATTGGSAPATGSLATVLSAARAEKGGESLPLKCTLRDAGHRVVLVGRCH